MFWHFVTNNNNFFCCITVLIILVVEHNYNRTTVEPPNKGQLGTSTNVRYSEVVLYWGVFAKNPSFFIFICCISFILHFYDILDRIKC